MLRRTLGATVLAVLAGAAGAQNRVAVAPTGDVRVTIYEGGRALFTERRRATVGAGMNDLEVTGIPTGAAEASVDLQVLGGPALKLLSQSIAPAKDRPRQALAALVGQPITLVRRGPQGTETLEGTLLRVATDGGVAALQVGDRVVLDPQGEVQVTQEQLALLARPTTLVCRVESPEAGDADLLISYLVGDVGWEAQHSVVLSEDATTMSLESWAMARVPSAAGMTIADLLLSNGPLLIDIGRPVTFGPTASVRLALAQGRQTPVTNLLLFDAGALEKLAGGKPVEGPVLRVVRFSDTAEAGLGAAIAAGPVTIYQRAGAGAKLISQASMPAAAPGATVDLALGEVAGLRATSKQASWRQLSPEDVERKGEVLITNAGGTAVTATCGVTMSGKWRIDEASHPYVARAENRVEFTVPLAAGQKRVTLSYTVRLEVTPAAGGAEGEGEAPPVPAGVK